MEESNVGVECDLEILVIFVIEMGENVFLGVCIYNLCGGVVLERY